MPEIDPLDGVLAPDRDRVPAGLSTGNAALTVEVHITNAAGEVIDTRGFGITLDDPRFTDPRHPDFPSTELRDELLAMVRRLFILAGWKRPPPPPDPPMP